MQSRIFIIAYCRYRHTIFKKGVENQDTYHQDPGNLVTGF